MIDFLQLAFFSPLQPMYLAFRCSRLTRHLSWLNRLIQKHLFSAALLVWSSAAFFVLYVPMYQHRFVLEHHKKSCSVLFILHSLLPILPATFPSKEFGLFGEGRSMSKDLCVCFGSY